jgi:ATP-dependent DNA ligase
VLYRSASKKTGLQAEKSENVPYIVQAFDCLPPHTILVGEVYYPGGSSKNVTEIMGCLPAKAIERQNGQWGQIHYYLHDILMYDGVDLVRNKVNNETRYKILQKIYELHKLNQYSFIELAEAWTDNLYERVGSALAAGEEGMVIKKKTGIYEPGKRPDSNLKAKKVDFADVVIIGFEEPTKEYYGKEIENWQYWIGTDDHEYRYPVGYHYGEPCAIAVTKPYYMEWYNSRIHIGAYNKEGKLEDIGIIHSGISDEMKEDMSINPDNYLGKVCAIQCMEKSKSEHTIRHGFFKYMREDKDAKDCIIDTIF